MADGGGTVTRDIDQAETADPTAALPVDDDPGPGDSLGHLTIGERIGEGGMGVVFAARDARLLRDVAVKMVRFDTATARARILREAQAMAQLSHPNVVTVHHVESAGERVFITMELVAGGNLRSWLERSPRRWREIVGRFIEAGRGLAVAHDKGIVHRDFKPDNVLLDDDGPARVADFGLASVDARELDADVDGTAPLSVSVTRTGALLGTPFYMAPEQHLGERATDRSDQFSFCVAVYEALYGAHPFGGESLAELASTTVGGDLGQRPSRPRLPARLHAAIARGLSREPDDRHPSMAALVDELEAILYGGSRRRLAIAGGAVVVAGAIAIAAFARRDDPPRCEAAAEAVDAIWNDAAAEQISEAFAATGVDGAPRVARQLRERLDAYASELRAARAEACEATARRGEQSEQLLDRRIACLDRRSGALGGLVSELDEPTRELIDRALDAAEDLPSLAPCDDREQLLASYPLPEGAGSRARLAALESAIDALDTERSLGRYREVVDRAPELDAVAATIDYPSARGRLDSVVAEALAELGDLEASERRFRSARIHASKAGDTRLSAEVLVSMTYIVGSQLGRADAGRELGEMAQLEIDKLGGDKRIESSLALNLAALDNLGGDYESALAHVERAMALREGDPNASPKKRAKTHALAGWFLAKLGRPAEAREQQENALAIYESALGPDHPKIGGVLVTLALTAIKTGALDEADGYVERATGLLDRHAPKSFERALVEIYAGQIDAGRGDHRAAIAHYRKAEAMATALTTTADHPYVAMALEPRGVSHLARGETDQAIEALERARAIRARHLGADNAETARAAFHLARAIATADRSRRAEAVALARAQRPRLAAADLEALDRWLAETR